MRATMTDLERGLDQLFGRAADELGSLYRAAECQTVPLDLYETDDGFVLRLDVPGIPREAISLTVEEQRLWVRGERKAIREEGVRYHRHERRDISFKRSFKLPDSVDPGSVSAALSDGVLEVTLDKVAKREPQVVEIKVN